MSVGRNQGLGWFRRQHTNHPTCVYWWSSGDLEAAMKASPHHGGPKKKAVKQRGCLSGTWTISMHASCFFQFREISCFMLLNFRIRSRTFWKEAEFEFPERTAVHPKLPKSLKMPFSFQSYRNAAIGRRESHSLTILWRSP